MDREKRLISVVMPHYNQSNLIPNAINSILNQTFQDWELIIVDDGSDNIHLNHVYNLLHKINDKRIYLQRETHQGLVNARNVGNEIANGRYIFIQDADDLSLPDRLEKCLTLLSKDVQVVYHGAYINMWDKSINAIGRKYLPAPEFSKEELLRGQNIPGWLAFQKKVWKQKPFRMATQYMYDWMMCLDWAYSGYSFGRINEGLYEYVRHENSASISFEKDGRRNQSYLKIKEIMQKEYGAKIS